MVGVGLSSYSDSSFHILGFLAAGLSNFMFSMRGINTKQLRWGGVHLASAERSPPVL